MAPEDTKQDMASALDAVADAKRKEAQDAEEAAKKAQEDANKARA